MSILAQAYPYPFSSKEDKKDISNVIVEVKMHDLPRWKREVLERVSLLVSEAARGLLTSIRELLIIRQDDEDPEKVATADLVFMVNAEQAARVQDLLAQPRKLDKKGDPLPFTNSYRFISCDTVGPDEFRVVSRLALGIWQEKKNRKGEVVRTHYLSVINATAGLQGLLNTYFRDHPAYGFVPDCLRPGINQEVAQQVASYIGQLESSRVKGETAFPTREIRDPDIRRVIYKEAIDALTSDVRSFERISLRQKNPAKFAEDDPRGNRLIVDDERWFAVLKSPDPHPIPLLFVKSKLVTLLRGDAHFSAGISKKNRHRGKMQSNERVLSSRPTKVQKNGVTYLQSWYAAIPLLNLEDPVIREILARRDAERAISTGRGLDQHLTPMSVTHKQRWRKKENEILVPLSANRDRVEQIFMRTDMEIAWTRVIQKIIRKEDREKKEWFLQITLRMKNPPLSVSNDRVLGVSFGIDAVATWCVINRDGTLITSGALAPNEQIIAFLKEKSGLEWDQAKKRWIGGLHFSRKLESIAHAVVNTLIALSEEHDAILAIEDISYAPKQGRDHVRNVLFTAWNYGQMRRFAGYKSPMAGRGMPLFVSDYLVTFTCPQCGACRKKGETVKNATTWRENGILHCRSCSFSGELTQDMKAMRVALEGKELLVNAEKRRKEREEEEESSE